MRRGGRRGWELVVGEDVCVGEGGRDGTCGE